jgi:hypothetical protein
VSLFKHKREIFVAEFKLLNGSIQPGWHVLATYPTITAARAWLKKPDSFPGKRILRYDLASAERKQKR